MSHVTDVLIFTLPYDSGMDQVNKWNPGGFVFSVKSVDDPDLPRGWYGGSKMLSSDIWIGAINNLDLQTLVTFLKSVEWELPECVQLLVKEPDDIIFKFISIQQ